MTESAEGRRPTPEQAQEQLEQALFEIRRIIAGQDAMLERVLVCLLAGLALELPASAYTDPGSGALLWQLLLHVKKTAPKRGSVRWRKLTRPNAGVLTSRDARQSVHTGTRLY